MGAPGFHDGPSSLKVIRSLIRARNLVAGNVRQACFGNFERMPIVGHPTSCYGAQAVGHELSGKIGAVEVLSQSLRGNVAA